MESVIYFLKFTGILALGLFLTTCSGDEEEVVGKFSNDKSELRYDPGDGRESVNIQSPSIIAWGVKSNSTRLNFSKTSGLGIAIDPSATVAWGGEDWMEAQFQKMYDDLVSQGIGVILGEYGASYRENVSGAETYREYYYQKSTQVALEQNIVPIIWDNGYSDNHQMGLFNRINGSEYFPDLIDAITTN